MKILEVSKYFEYGVGVGMFMVSVILLILVFRYFTKSNEQISENFSKTISNLDDKHRDERDLWQSAEDRRLKTTQEVVMRIDTTIRECLMQKVKEEDTSKASERV